MTAIHQLLPAAAPRDAITNQAFAWRELLHQWGYESEIVAEGVHPDMLGIVRRTNRSGRRLLKSGRILLRYALWSETAKVAVGSGRPVALCYHNITPGKLVRAYNPGLAELCDRGRAALAGFRGKLDVLVADSAFNAAELREAGLGEAAIVPLLLQLPERVSRRPPGPAPVVVTVGRIVPNKRLDDVIKAFTLYQRRHASEASLVIVGSDLGFEAYRVALEVLVARLGTRGVVFTGPISSEARDAWYRGADAYLSMSVHEGFCAPLIEALAHGVPVVARAAGAVPETLGEAGVVLDGADLPLVSEALQEVTSSQPTRTALLDAAERRLAELRPDVLAPRIRAALTPLLT